LPEAPAVNRLPFSRIALLATLGLLAPSAWAQTELVALHPCVLEGAKPKKPKAAQSQPDELEAICATEIARSDAQLVPSDQVRDVLAKEPEGSCALKEPKRNLCLGRLATATKASRALLITINPGTLTRVSGVVVNPSGEVLDQKSVQLRNRNNQPLGELVRTAVTRLREQLPLAPAKVAAREAPAQPAPDDTLAPLEPAPAEPAPPPAPPALAAAPAPAASAPGLDLSFLAGRSWKTPTAYASAGVGVAGLVLATVFTAQAGNTLQELDAPYADGKLPPYSELGRLSGLQRTLNTQRTVAGVSAAVGAALVGTGVYLWLSDRQQPGAPAAPGVTALSAGPGGINVRVVLP
jgi:hypothetical protein